MHAIEINFLFYEYKNMVAVVVVGIVVVRVVVQSQLGVSSTCIYSCVLLTVY